MGTGRRGPGAYRPPKDMWDAQKRTLYWIAGLLFAVVAGLFLLETTLLRGE